MILCAFAMLARLEGGISIGQSLHMVVYGLRLSYWAFSSAFKCVCMVYDKLENMQI